MIISVDQSFSTYTLINSKKNTQNHYYWGKSGSTLQCRVYSIRKWSTKIVFLLNKEENIEIETFLRCFICSHTPLAAEWLQCSVATVGKMVSCIINLESEKETTKGDITVPSVGVCVVLCRAVDSCWLSHRQCLYSGGERWYLYNKPRGCSPSMFFLKLVLTEGSHVQVSSEGQPSKECMETLWLIRTHWIYNNMHLFECSLHVVVSITAEMCVM